MYGFIFYGGAVYGGAYPALAANLIPKIESTALITFMPTNVVNGSSHCVCKLRLSASASCYNAVAVGTMAQRAVVERQVSLVEL